MGMEDEATNSIADALEKYILSASGFNVLDEVPYEQAHAAISQEAVSGQEG
jgi:hypothetical protein